MMMNNQLRAEQLSLERGFNCLFTDLSFSLSSGQCLNIAGQNGAGKSSLLKVLATLTPALEGAIYWNNVPANSDDTYLQQLCYLGHDNALHRHLNARQNLEFLCALSGPVKRQHIDELLEQFAMTAYADLPVYSLSQGQKQKIALLRVFVLNQPVWLLDEPATALDRTSIGQLEDKINTHLGAGGLVIYTSHQPLNLANPPEQIDVSHFGGHA